MGSEKPFRVLCLDGGGMRGLYQATYLSTFASRMLAKQPESGIADVGRAFDLIVGTSTGGIVACALASGKPLGLVTDLYQRHGAKIFPWQRARTVPVVNLVIRGMCRKNVDGDAALRSVLQSAFGSESVGEMYQRRGIALGIPAVNLARDAPVVFKTPHLQRLNHRDDERTLVDICMATSAAPILRSIARLPEPGAPGTYAAYADGGLWANNPAVVGVTEAGEILDERGETNQPIHLFSLGTLPAQGGELISDRSRHRGAWGWTMGLRALEVGVNAQGDGYDYIASKVAQLLGRGSFAYRLPSQPPAASLTTLLQNMDDARPEFLDALAQQAVRDVDHAWSFLHQRTELQSFRDALLTTMCANPNRGSADVSV